MSGGRFKNCPGYVIKDHTTKLHLT